MQYRPSKFKPQNVWGLVGSSNTKGSNNFLNDVAYLHILLQFKITPTLSPICSDYIPAPRPFVPTSQQLSNEYKTSRVSPEPKR